MSLQTNKNSPSRLRVASDWKSLMLEEHCLYAVMDDDLQFIEISTNLKETLKCNTLPDEREKSIVFLDVTLFPISYQRMKELGSWVGKIKLKDADANQYITNGRLQGFFDEKNKESRYMLIMDYPEDVFLREYAQHIPVENANGNNKLETMIMGSAQNDADIPNIHQFITPKIIEPAVLENVIMNLLENNSNAKSQTLIYSMDIGVPERMESYYPDLNDVIIKSVIYSILSTKYGVVAVHFSWDKHKKELTVSIDDTADTYSTDSNGGKLDYVLELLKKQSNAGNCTYITNDSSTGHAITITAPCDVLSEKKTRKAYSRIVFKNGEVADINTDKEFRKEFKINLKEIIETLSKKPLDLSLTRKMLHKNKPTLYYSDNQVALKVASKLHDAIKKNKEAEITALVEKFKNEINIIMAGL